MNRVLILLKYDSITHSTKSSNTVQARIVVCDLRPKARLLFRIRKDHSILLEQ
jgi:hypothetical protein